MSITVLYNSLKSVIPFPFVMYFGYILPKNSFFYNYQLLNASIKVLYDSLNTIFRGIYTYFQYQVQVWRFKVDFVDYNNLV